MIGEEKHAVKVHEKTQYAGVPLQHSATSAVKYRNGVSGEVILGVGLPMISSKRETK